MLLTTICSCGLVNEARIVTLVIYVWLCCTCKLCCRIYSVVRTCKAWHRLSVTWYIIIILGRNGCHNIQPSCIVEDGYSLITVFLLFCAFLSLSSGRPAVLITRTDRQTGSSSKQQESPAVADKPTQRESMPKIAPIRRAYNVVADNSGLHLFSCCCVQNLRNPEKFSENSNL